MSNKETSKGKESKNIDIVELVRKAKNLYDEYGETVISISESIGLKDKIMKNTTISEISAIVQNQEKDTVPTKKMGFFKKKKSKRTDVVELVRKAKELYDEYGETMISISESLGLKDKIMKNTTISQISAIVHGQDIEPAAEVEETEDISELEETPRESATMDIKSLRGEIEADDSFHESLSTLENAASIAFDGRLTNPQEVSKALESLMAVAQDTIKYSEEQETRREEIRAMRDLAISRVNAMREAVQTYLNKSFDERSVLFAKQFECVDTALKTGDNDMLACSLNSINSLAASSPFKNLADLGQVKDALTSSDTEWDI